MSRCRLRAILAFAILMTATTVHGAAVTVRRGIEYAQTGDVRLLLDAYVPHGHGPFPAAVIVHGGGWVAGDRRLSVEPLFRPLQDAGFACFSISYRLAHNAALFGAAIQDVEQAVLFVRAHAAEYGIDPGRIVLVGESAGAQLASMAALSQGLKGMVKGVVALYCPSDLVMLARTSDRVPTGLRRAVEGTPLAEFLLSGLQRLSPIYNVRTGIPPFLLIHGTADSLVPFQQSVNLCQRIHDAGASCELYPVKGGGHGILWWDHDKNLTSYKGAMTGWLEKLFERPSPAADSNNGH